MYSNPAAIMKDISSSGNLSTFRLPLFANFGLRDSPGFHFVGRGTQSTCSKATENERVTYSRILSDFNPLQVIVPLFKSSVRPSYSRG